MKKADIESMTDDLVRSLNESEALYKPDPHAGNILVDPVIIAALSHWWGEYKKHQVPELTVLSDEEMANLSNVFPEGFTGRVGLMIAKAQRKHTKRELGE